MTTRLATLIPVLLLACAPAGARADAVAELLDASGLAQHAFYTGDSNQLLSARSELERIAATGNLGALAHYYAGYADFHLAQLAMESDRGMAGDRLDRCIEEARKAFKLNRDFAEAYALSAACHGLKAAAQPWKAVYHTPQAGRMMKKAIELEAANPRVVLLDAISDYLVPRPMGGNKERAEQRFNEAVDLFESGFEVARGEPDWGHAEAYAYLGEISLARADAIAARNAVEQALLIAPEFEWAQQMLRQITAAN